MKLKGCDLVISTTHVINHNNNIGDQKEVSMSNYRYVNVKSGPEVTAPTPSSVSRRTVVLLLVQFDWKRETKTKSVRTTKLVRSYPARIDRLQLHLRERS
jgi:hypothetical protein